MIYYILLSAIFMLLILFLDRKVANKLQDQSSVKLRGLYEIENTYGPLNLAESQELAWPYKQSISIKYPNDNYPRLANVSDIEDDLIKYIGAAQDCWLRLEPVPNCDIRNYHWGFVRSRGRYYIFEVQGAPTSRNLNYDWWNHAYREVVGNARVESGPISLTIYRNDRPITIEGKNTNGVAVIDIDNKRFYRAEIIGSAPNCWITLPDPDLPPYLAIRRSRGHHRVLYDYYNQESDQYLTRADRAFEIGGYHITL